MTKHTCPIEDRRGAVSERDVNLCSLRQPVGCVAATVTVQVSMHRLACRCVVVSKHHGGRHVTGHTTLALSNKAADQFHTRAVLTVHGRHDLGHAVAVVIHTDGRGEIGALRDHASLESIIEHLPSEQFVTDDGVDLDASVDGGHLHFPKHRAGIDQGAVPQNAFVPHQPEFAGLIDDGSMLTVLMKHEGNGRCINLEHEGADVPHLIDVHRIREGLTCRGQVLSVPDDEARAVIGRGRYGACRAVADVVNGGDDAGGPRGGDTIGPRVVLGKSAMVDLPLVVNPAQMAHACW